MTQMAQMRRDLPTPLSGQVKNDLVAQIRSGRLRGRAPGELRLAQLYGVSRVTVRKALAELERDGLLTRSRGRGTYVTDATGTKLKTVHFVLHHTPTGLETPSYNYPIVQDVLAGVASETRRRGLAFNALSADYYTRNPGAALEGLGASDGLVVAGSCELTAAAIARGIPVVTAYVCYSDSPSASWVVYNRLKAVELGMKHLMDCGARDVAYALWQPVNEPGWMDKVRVARWVAQSHGGQLPPERLIDASPYAEVVEEQVLAYLRTRKPPDAFFCGTDDVGAGILAAARRLGLVVPDHLMVLGYSDFAVAARTTPALSTVRVPRFEMGARAVDALARLAEHGPDGPPVRETLQAELVVRGTTRAGL